MYIPEFWCGVISTLVCEVAFSIVLTVITELKGGGKDETTKETD